MLYSSKLFEHISFIKSEMTNAVVVGAGLPGTREYKLGNMVRCGFGLSLFVTLENHINSAARQVIAELNLAKMAYQSFPVNLRKILILNSLIGVDNQITLNKTWNDQQKLSYAESEIQRLSKFNATPPEYSGVGFNFKGSNLYADDIANFTKALAKDANWEYLGLIVQAIGGSRPDLKTDFDTLVRMRHSVAHKQEPELNLSTLQMHLDSATAIAIGFNLAAFYIGYLIKTLNSFDLINNARNDYMKYTRFITACPTRGFACIGPSGKNLKFHNDLRAALDWTFTRGKNTIAILKDDRGLPIDIFIKGNTY